MPSYSESKPWLKTYPQWLPHRLEVTTDSVLAAFWRSADARPEQPCIHYFDCTLSYRQVAHMARSLSAALAEMGLSAGDRLMVVMQNIPQAVITCLAAWMRRAVVVPLNPMYTGEDLAGYLADCGAKVIACQDDLFEARVETAAGRGQGVRVITTSAVDLLAPDQPPPAQLAGSRRRRFEGTEDFMALVARAEGRQVPPLFPGRGDLAYLVYTSGTTGPAKGAQIRHGNVMHNAMVYEAACRLGGSDVVLGVAPLFHITGIVAHLAIAFHLGIPVILSARFDAGEALRLIERYRATFTVAAITVYIALLDHPRRTEHRLDSFTKAYSGGAPVSPSTVARFREAMGLEIYNVYGLTESCSPATITPLGLQGPVDEDSGALSVGLVVPGHEAWIVDLDHPEKELPPGGEGELVLRGPGITDGYWQKPAETAHAIRDGCFFTGDVAKFDEAGWCYIVDRKKDLINASGYKVWPREVEDVLYRHPAVKEAAVVGVPDPYRGETVKAFVSLAAGHRGRVSPEELIDFCRQRMAAYKYPRQVEIIDEVPKTLTGKFLRRRLRDEGGAADG